MYPVTDPRNIIQFSAACSTSGSPVVGLAVLYRYTNEVVRSDQASPIISAWQNQHIYRVVLRLTDTYSAPELRFSRADAGLLARIVEGR